MRQMGMRLPYRHDPMETLVQMTEPSDLMPANQTTQRARTEQFVQAHWTVLSETLNCLGNCSQAENTCPDAQASICYNQNKRLIDV